jgi:hypothetical protein
MSKTRVELETDLLSENAVLAFSRTRSLVDLTDQILQYNHKLRCQQDKQFEKYYRAENRRLSEIKELDKNG